MATLMSRQLATQSHARMRRIWHRHDRVAFADESSCSDAIRFYLTTSIFQFSIPITDRRGRVMLSNFQFPNPPGISRFFDSPLSNPTQPKRGEPRLGISRSFGSPGVRRSQQDDSRELPNAESPCQCVSMRRNWVCAAPGSTFDQAESISIFRIKIETIDGERHRLFGL